MKKLSHSPEVYRELKSLLIEMLDCCGKPSKEGYFQTPESSILMELAVKNKRLWELINMDHPSEFRVASMKICYWMLKALNPDYLKNQSNARYPIFHIYRKGIEVLQLITARDLRKVKFNGSESHAFYAFIETVAQLPNTPQEIWSFHDSNNQSTLKKSS